MELPLVDAVGNGKTPARPRACEARFPVPGIVSPLDVLTSSREVASDAQGNIFVAGSVLVPVTFGDTHLDALERAQGYLVKFDPSCRILWSKALASDSLDVGVAGVAVDGSGNVVIVGTTMRVGSVDFGGGPLVDEGQIFSGYVAKFDANGAHLVSRIFGAGESISFGRVALDGANNILISGTASADATLDGIAVGDPSDYRAYGFVLKLDALAGTQWAFALAGQNGPNLAVAPSGALYVAGVSYDPVLWPDGAVTSDTNYFAYLARFDGAGQRAWAANLGTLPDYDSDITSDLAIGPGERAYLLRSSVLPGDIQRRYVRRTYAVDAHGTTLWRRLYQTDEKREALYDGIALDAQGRVLETGVFSGLLVFGHDRLRTRQTDRFVLRRSANGDAQSAMQLAESGTLWGMGLAIDAQNSAILWGVNAIDSADPSLPNAFELVLHKRPL